MAAKECKSNRSKDNIMKKKQKIELILGFAISAISDGINMQVRNKSKQLLSSAAITYISEYYGLSTTESIRKLAEFGAKSSYICSIEIDDEEKNKAKSHKDSSNGIEISKDDLIELIGKEAFDELSKKIEDEDN